jgi:O-antigen/teichoic acid export membrane protein
VPVDDLPDASATPLTTSRSDAEILATAKGGGFLVGGTFFAFAVRFLIALVLARSLGAAQYGLYVLAISAATLVSGISLVGLDDAMVRYVAIYLGRKDQEGIGGALQIGVGVGTVLGLLSGAILFVLAQPIAVDVFHTPALEPLLKLFAFVVPFLSLSNTLLGTARGFKRMDYAAYSEKGVQSLVRLGLVVILWLPGWLTVKSAAVAFALSDVASSIVLIMLLNRIYPMERVLQRGQRRDTRAIFHFAIPLWMSGLLRQFRRNIQKVMLGALATVAAVGIFSIANTITLVAGVAAGAIYVASRPLFAQQHDRGDKHALGALYKATTRWSLVLYMPFFLIMVLYPSQLLHVFGQEFTAGAAALVIVSFSQLADAATGTCQGMIDMTGHTRAKLANAILYTVLLVGSGWLLIPPYGLIGAAWSAVIAEVGVNGVSLAEVWFFEHLFPFDRTFWKPGLAALIAYAAGLGLRQVHPGGGGIIAVGAQSVLIMGLFAGLLLLFRLEPEDRMIIDSALAKLGKRLRRGGDASSDVGSVVE